MNDIPEMHEEETAAGVTEDDLQSFLHYDAMVSIRFIDKDNTYRAFSEGFNQDSKVKGIQSQSLYEFDHLGFMFKIVPYSMSKNLKAIKSSTLKEECKFFLQC